MCDRFLSLRMGGLGWVAFDAPRITKLVSRKKWLALWGVLKMGDSLLRGVAQVVFVNNPLSGFLILLGLFIADVTVGVATVYCTALAFFVAKGVLDLPDGSLHAGLPLFSPVLVGSVTASLFTPFFHAPITPSVWGYMGLASVFSVCVFAGLDHMLSTHNLPAYTLPFNIATSLIFLGMRGAGYGSSPAVEDTVDLNITASLPDDIQVDWSKVWLGSLLSAGQVWAVESVACSVLVIIAMFICSPVLTAACFIGGTLGTFTALELSQAPYTLVYAGVWGYNGFLAAGAIMYFAVASPRVVALAVINAVLATFIQAGLIPPFSQNNLPVFTFPFCLASFLLLAASSSSSSSSFVRVASPTIPEVHFITQKKEPLSEERREEKEEIAITHMI